MNMQEIVWRARCRPERSEGDHTEHGPLRVAQGDTGSDLVHLVRLRGDHGVEIVNVERGALAVGCLAHYLLQQSQRVLEAGGEGVLERERRRFALPGLREIGGEKAIGDDGVNVSFSGMGQAVTTLDLGEEALCDQQALLLKGGSKHHISPRLREPATAGAAGWWLAVGRRQRPERAARWRCYAYSG